MSLIETLKADQLTARKAKDATKASLLTTLIGEAVMVGKNDGNRESTDAEVTAVIKKFVKNANETISALGGPDKEAATKFVAEVSILNAYLPTQLDEATLRSKLTEQFAGPYDKASKGAMMKYLKENFNGQYDGKIAANVIDTILAG